MCRSSTIMGKKPLRQKWQVQPVDAAMVLKWDRFVHNWTGISVESGLAVIDVDIEFADRADLVEQLTTQAELILQACLSAG